MNKEETLEYFNKSIESHYDNDIKKHLETFESIKSVTVDNDNIVKEEFHGDLGELSPMSKEEQYESLMNIFLSRKDKRKLNKYKGKKTFTDKIYGR